MEVETGISKDEEEAEEEVNEPADCVEKNLSNDDGVNDGASSELTGSNRTNSTVGSSLT